MDTNELNELDIKLNLYDEICREFDENNWGKDDWKTVSSIRKIIKHLGNEIAFSCRIEDLLSFLADKYSLDSNCMVLKYSDFAFKDIRGISFRNPRYFSKYELVGNEMGKIQKKVISIKGYSEMPQQRMVSYYDGTIGSINIYGKPIRRKNDLFKNCKPCFEISIASLFDFAEPQADGKPLLEHCRVSCFSSDDSVGIHPEYRHKSRLILESDPYDVFLHIPVSFLANERSKNSTTYQLLSSYFESVQEKEAAVEKKKA